MLLYRLGITIFLIKSLNLLIGTIAIMMNTEQNIRTCDMIILIEARSKNCYYNKLDNDRRSVVCMMKIG